MKLDDLKTSLLSTDDGRVACDAIDKLAKLAAKGDNEAKAVLATYVRDGKIKHMKSHACSCLADAIKEPHPGFAAVFHEGLADPDVRYWSILGYVNAAGKAVYPELIRLAEDETLPLEHRAHAIKCISKLSKQKFDRGAPSDPGFWKERHFRLAELRAWAASGYPDGIGYAPPNRHPAIDNPQTDFEKIVHKLDKKLARARKKEQDLAAPTDWIVVADSQDIDRITARWNLPSTYLDFLTRFSPLRVIIRTRKFYNSFWLFGAGDLLVGQNGYAFDPTEKKSIPDWPQYLVVIGSHGGDPYVLDLSRSDGTDAPVLTAEHGAGEWKFEPAADSFTNFLKQLAS